MTAFRVWAPHDGDRPARCNITAADAEQAAEKWVELYDADLDYPDETRVLVEDALGDVSDFTVEREQSVSFHARAAEPTRPSAHDLALATSIEDTLHLDELCEDAS